MARTKISEFSATPGNNTDIDGINIAEGCPPSGINDAIRELMAQLKDFQAGTSGDSFNGPIGATTPAAGTFTNLSASGTFALTGDQVQISEGGTGQTTANAAFNALAPSQSTHAGKYLKTDGTNTSWDAIDINTADITGTLPIANGGTGLTALGTGVQTALGIAVGSAGAFVVNGGALGTPSSGTVTNLTGTASININGTVGATTPTTGAFTTLSASGNITVSGGTANGVAYLNGSKVLTTGSALNFDGTNLGIGTPTPLSVGGYTFTDMLGSTGAQYRVRTSTADLRVGADASSTFVSSTNTSLWFGANNAEGMRLTSTGLGIGTSSPARKFEVHGTPLSIGGTATGMLVSIVNNNTAFNASPTSGISLWNRFNSGGSTFPSAALQAGKENATDGNYAGYLSFYTVDSVGGVNERMRLDSSGNLGLGVTPSAWGVYKAADLNTRGLGLAGGDQSYAITCNAYYDGTTWRYKGTSSYGVTRLDSFDGAYVFYTAPSGNAGDPISFSQVMTLDASGNLGIGTSSPGAKLDVAGTFNGTQAVFGNTSGRGLLIGTALNGGVNEGSTVLNARGAGNGQFLFQTDGTTRLTISDSGNLGLGVTPSAWGTGFQSVIETKNIGVLAAAGPYVSVMANAYYNSSNQYIYKTSAQATHYAQALGQHQWFTAGSGTAGNTISFTQAMTLDASGNLLVGTTSAGARLRVKSEDALSTNYGLFVTDSSDNLMLGTRNDGYVRAPSIYNQTTASAANVAVDSSGYLYRSTSSLKYKTNVQDATHGLAEVMQLRPVTYKGKNDGDKVFGGLIAEEVHAAGLTEFVQYAPDGSPDALAYGNMVSLCIKAIQEQQAIITDLRARVAHLEAK